MLLKLADANTKPASHLDATLMARDEQQPPRLAGTAKSRTQLQREWRQRQTLKQDRVSVNVGPNGRKMFVQMGRISDEQSKFRARVEAATQQVIDDLVERWHRENVDNVTLSAPRDYK